ncbi:hypothetical protein DICPUDRAFT_160310 [Dictyostelium purpureum]|uniref:Saposin B-type domain-containing protein n=1 Tax=Dictyostelium purpureum TaxID=5786 RepID=F1A645_DICPU|nr:uncharacterized protein DICPUDRAFT_160310 [Dictyostelium purpureum]EGC28335.1 hypothetical protein DICPUDRAFT_160310 [Dictyostelium purpureum]|eukprot:XP_003295140.1 hypothetical protein DICPUDRAFT_160310 [Dictyostelium purpureum]
MKLQTFLSITFILLIIAVFSSATEKQEICETCRGVFDIAKKFHKRRKPFTPYQITQEVSAICMIYPTADIQSKCREMSSIIPTFINYIDRDVEPYRGCLEMGYCH